MPTARLIGSELIPMIEQALDHHAKCISSCRILRGEWVVIYHTEREISVTADTFEEFKRICEKYGYEDRDCQWRVQQLPLEPTKAVYL